MQISNLSKLRFYLDEIKYGFPVNKIMKCTRDFKNDENHHNHNYSQDCQEEKTYMEDLNRTKFL